MINVASILFSIAIFAAFAIRMPAASFFYVIIGSTSAAILYLGAEILFDIDGYFYNILLFEITRLLLILIVGRFFSIQISILFGIITNIAPFVFMDRLYLPSLDNSIISSINTNIQYIIYILISLVIGLKYKMDLIEKCHPLRSLFFALVASLSPYVFDMNSAIDSSWQTDRSKILYAIGIFGISIIYLYIYRTRYANVADGRGSRSFEEV